MGARRSLPLARAGSGHPPAGSCHHRGSSALDMRHLRTFVAVAEAGGFRRAAERLYLSQPTVSAHMAAMEAEIGSPLVRRGGRTVALTPAGERLLPYARRLLLLHGEAEAAVRAWRRDYDERLRVVSSIFVAASVLPGALRRLVADHPRLDLALATAFSAEVVQAVGGGHADLGFARVPPTGDAVAGRRLSEEAVVAVAPAIWGRVAMAEALATRPLFTHNHPGYWDRLLSQTAAMGHAARAMAVRQVEVTKRLIGEGLGWSFLPWSAVGAEVRAGSWLQVAPLQGLELPSVGTWALWPADRPLTVAGERLVRFVAEAGCP